MVADCKASSLHWALLPPLECLREYPVMSTEDIVRQLYRSGEESEQAQAG